MPYVMYSRQDIRISSGLYCGPPPSHLIDFIDHIEQENSLLRTCCVASLLNSTVFDKTD